MALRCFLETQFLVASLAAIAAIPGLAQQDVTPPVLTGFTFNPMAVNTTTSAATVTLTEQITDDLSGVSSYLASIYFISPSGNYEVYCLSMYTGSLISGTDLNGTWQCQMSIPAYSEAGTWTVASVHVRDNVGNSTTYYTSDLQTLGFLTTLNVTSTPDTTPPALTGFTFSPMVVNTTTTAATVTLTEQITDDLSGVNYTPTYFISPSGNQVAACHGFLISGTDLNGTWQCQMSIPVYSEGGTWTVSSLYLRDNIGNSRNYTASDLQTLGFPITLNVTSNQIDTKPPVLTGFTFSPMAVDTTTSAATVTLTQQITDDLSGASYVPTYFFSPSGNQNVGCGLSLISGTNVDGTWQCQISIPAHSEGGTWTASSVYLRDNVGNSKNYTASDLQALGFPTQLIVGSDDTPPTTTATPSPGANSNGWNSTNVNVDLNAADNPGGSGVKQIQFSLGGAQNTGWTTMAGDAASVTISAEGTTILSYAATDNAGNRETTKTLTIKIDKTPPVISGMPLSGCTLWPLSGKLVQVATVRTQDAFSGLVSGSFIVTGTSNELSDPNNPDIVITRNSSGGYVVQLRADRLGTGTGRVYTLNATASDLAGNVTTKQATCSVPHDQGI